MSAAAFEAEEKRRLKRELEMYSRSVEEEMEREQERHKRNLDSLSKRKDDMIKDKKNKLKVSIFF